MQDEYDPTTCPVEGCEYEDAIRSVAAHVSRSSDDGHSWDALDYDGAREFVMSEKRRQHAESGGATATGNGAEDTGGESAASTPAPTLPPEDPPEFGLDLDFVRDVLVLFDAVEEYDVDSLDELDTFRLVNLYTLLSDVSSSADDARKEVRDKLLEVVQDDRRVESDFGAVKRTTHKRRNLKDERTVADHLEAAGIDPEEARSFDTKKVKKLVAERGLDESSVFDIEKRTYVRKSGADDERRRKAYNRLDPELRALVDDERFGGK
ncbi:hypothetical protein A4G99_10400 [Haladaptatus sp. R4]|uniref:hypothetical protein n=1 Tax=Haladaptatus sp. R4 TaxID=1679489 RepID=UPI0007B4A7A9|nr:hypothetical protein [Haladaptatus sp. R4]KZN24739.1 hypothetical protein A4G99_10400 [Haladaptatus sp. R4]